MSFYAVHGSDRTVSYVEAPEPAVAAAKVIKWNNDQPAPEGYESMFVVRVVEVAFEGPAQERAQYQTSTITDRPPYTVTNDHYAP